MAKSQIESIKPIWLDTTVAMSLAAYVLSEMRHRQSVYNGVFGSQDHISELQIAKICDFLRAEPRQTA